MKINFFFPVFEDDNIKNYLDYFTKTSFFKGVENYSFIFVVFNKDKNNLDFLISKNKKDKKFKLLILDKPFTYNDAFKQSLNYFDGDIILLGDTKVARIDVIFEKCLEKYNKKSNVVHIVKKKEKFKSFIYNIIHSIYNFFIKIFTDKKDRINVTSLGLIDKHVMDVLKVLPNKCCYLKNTKQLLGFETRTIYIPPNTQTYKLNFKKKTSSLIASFCSIGIFFSVIVLLFLLNFFLKTNILVYNIIGALLLVLSFLAPFIFLPKHFFDIRNNCEDKEFKIVEK